MNASRQRSPWLSLKDFSSTFQGWVVPTQSQSILTSISSGLRVLPFKRQPQGDVTSLQLLDCSRHSVLYTIHDKKSVSRTSLQNQIFLHQPRYSYHQVYFPIVLPRSILDESSIESVESAEQRYTWTWLWASRDHPIGKGWCCITMRKGYFESYSISLWPSEWRPLPGRALLLLEFGRKAGILPAKVIGMKWYRMEFFCHGTSGKKGILQMASNDNSILLVAYTVSYRNVFLFALPSTIYRVISILIHYSLSWTLLRPFLPGSYP